MLPSTVSSPLLGVLLLVCCAAARVAPDFRQDSRRAVPSSSQPVPRLEQPQQGKAFSPFSLPVPDPQQTHGIASFRLKQDRPCECLNGGHCHIRRRICQCPLGYSGAHCEIVDHELFALLDEAEATPAAPTKKTQQEEEPQPQPRPLVAAADWLFYVPLAASVVLLGALLRVFGVLAASYLGDKKRPLTVTVLARPMDDKASSGIYTLPPPYSEKDVVGFAHSTPFSKQQLQQLHGQQLQANYYSEVDSCCSCSSSLPFDEIDL